MPLHAIAIALQGLDAPLSVIMAAVQGLLGEDVVPPYQFGGGGTSVPGPNPRARPRGRRPAWLVPIPLMPREPIEEEEALLITGAL